MSLTFGLTYHPKAGFFRAVQGVPVVVITPENDNVNAYITAVSTKKVTIELSELPDPNLACDVYVHIQVVGK